MIPHYVNGSEKQTKLNRSFSPNLAPYYRSRGGRGQGGAIMSRVKNRIDTRSMLALPVVMLSLQGPLAAFADDNSALSPGDVIVDTVKPAEPVAEPAPRRYLQGEVTKHGSIEGSAATDTNLQPNLNGQASDGSPQLQGQTGTTDTATLYAQVEKKLDLGKHLTAEEFRSLGAGTYGIDATQTYYTRTAKVIRAYKDGPADRAGIKAGDTLIQDFTAAPRGGDPTRAEYDFSCSRVGDAKDFKVRRHGEILTFHLIAMNIEDIQETSIRHMYERLIEKTGFPVKHVPIAPPVTAGSILRGLLGF